MSATTPLWVPLAIAAVGIAGTLGAPILAKWQEGHREDAVRWLQGRQQAYARLIAALYAWDDELRRDRPDTAELDRLRVAAREARALVDLMAPDETVRSLARSAQMDRDEFRTIDPAKKEEEWKQVRDRTVPLIEAMRSDLGLQNKRPRSQRSADTSG